MDEHAGTLNRSRHHSSRTRLMLVDGIYHIFHWLLPLLFSQQEQRLSDFHWERRGRWWEVWELAEALFISTGFLTQVPIDGPNKSLYHYVREAGLSPSGTSKCQGTFCSVTASSVTTPALPQQHCSLLCSPSLHPPNTNSPIPILSFSSNTKRSSLFTPLRW